MVVVNNLFQNVPLNTVLERMASENPTHIIFMQVSNHPANFLVCGKPKSNHNLPILHWLVQ